MLGDDTWHGIHVKWCHLAWYTCQVMKLDMVYMSGDDTWHGIYVKW